MYNTGKPTARPNQQELEERLHSTRTHTAGLNVEAGLCYRRAPYHGITLNDTN